MADRSVELYSAIYGALVSNAALTALIGADRVYDIVPAGAACPYVVIGDETAIDRGTSQVDAQEHTITVHVWSEAASTLPCKRIQAAVRAALHEQVLPLAAGTLCLLRCEFKETMRDPDGVSVHGVLRFRAVTNS